MAYIGKSPTAAPLTSSDVTDGIITNAKLAQDIISADTALGAEPADTDELLVSDAGVLKRMDYSHIKSSPGLVKLITTTLGSNTATIAFDSTYITSTYLNYLVIFNLKPETDNQGLSLRISVGGTFRDGGTDYGQAGYQDGGVDENDNDRDNIELTNGCGVGNASGENVSGHLFLNGISSASWRTKISFNINRDTTDGLHGLFMGGASVNVTEANDGIKFYFDNDDILSGSQATLYGINQ